jgi:hypothetical protein
MARPSRTHIPPERQKRPSRPSSRSPGATANPPSGEARDFFAEGGVAYTVTAEDGRTTKTCTARATVELSAACEILSFSVDDEAWTTG